MKRPLTLAEIKAYRELAEAARALRQAQRRANSRILQRYIRAAEGERGTDAR